MKRKDIVILLVAGLVTGFISMIIAGVVFNPAAKRAKAPVAEPLSTSLPDIKNDTAYSNFLNKDALDPAAPVKLGNSQNNKPFSATQ
jgi:hypothetical protein